jgi:hypothetical protein
MPDVNYAVGGNCKEDTTGNTKGDKFLTIYRSAFTTTTCRVSTVDTGFAVADVAEVYVTITR